MFITNQLKGEVEMPNYLPFINRDKELAFIDELINQWGRTSILCINADGGIGKTRLLKEVTNKYDREQFHIADIIDFDDQTLHIAENLNTRIALTLDETIFAPFLRSIDDYRKMEIAGVSHKTLEIGFERGKALFIECFNRLSSMKRIIILFDSIEKIHGTDCLKYVLSVFPKLTNFLCVVSGRNMYEISNELHSVNQEIIHNIELFPFNENASKKYLQMKQDILHIRLDSDISQKIHVLSGGKPIIIDLAVEWLTRDIPMWLFEYEIKFISEKEYDILHKFEHDLVAHIAQTRSKMDFLFLLMSHVYPLDIPLISIAFTISENEAQNLFYEARKYVFIKLLPDKRIMLYDEMRRIINTYVWDKVDPYNRQRKRYSKLAVEYFEKRIESFYKEIHNNENIEKIKRVAFEMEIWNLKSECLKHSLFINIEYGVKTFVQLFEEATINNQLNFRDTLIIQVQKYIHLLSDTQRYEIDIRRIRNLLYRGDYEYGKSIAENILKTNSISPEKKVEALILYANAERGLGNINSMLSIFIKSVEICKKEGLKILLVKAMNGLGRAYCMIGDLENARRYYHEALKLCIEEGFHKPELIETYNWITTNLAFTLSYYYKTPINAIDMTISTIENWKSINNKIGEGAAYMVLGVAYYRIGITNESLMSFEKALDIFIPLKYNDWIGQVYSWRGALFQSIGNYDQAKEDLEKSLRIGSSNIKPMTLNRLARVYISIGQLEKAEDLLKESLTLSKQLPDYMYWLGAIARLAIIESEKKEYQRFYEFEKELYNCLTEIKYSEKNYLGMVYIALAKLALGRNDIKWTEKIVDLLKRGIPLLTEYNTYASTGIIRILNSIENDFDKINPEIIHYVGMNLQEIITDKEIEDVTYSMVSPIIYKWANWGR